MFYFFIKLVFIFFYYFFFQDILVQVLQILLKSKLLVRKLSITSVRPLHIHTQASEMLTRFLRMASLFHSDFSLFESDLDSSLSYTHTHAHIFAGVICVTNKKKAYL